MSSSSTRIVAVPECVFGKRSGRHSSTIWPGITAFAPTATTIWNRASSPSCPTMTVGGGTGPAWHRSDHVRLRGRPMAFDFAAIHISTALIHRITPAPTSTRPTRIRRARTGAASGTQVASTRSSTAARATASLTWAPRPLTTCRPAAAFPPTPMECTAASQSPMASRSRTPAAAAATTV